MNNPLNYALLDTYYKKPDKTYNVMKLKNTVYKKEVIAQVHTIIDPLGDGAGRMQAVMNQAINCMRVSAHKNCTFNYSFFQRNIPKSRKQKKPIAKVALLGEVYKKTFYSDFKKRVKEEKEYSEEEIQELISEMLKTLAFFQTEYIYHSNVTMKNIVVDEDPEKELVAKYRLTEFNDAQKALLMMYPSEQLNYCSDQMLKALSPETREDIINNQEFEGDW